MALPVLPDNASEIYIFSEQTLGDKDLPVFANYNREKPYNCTFGKKTSKCGKFQIKQVDQNFIYKAKILQ